MRACERSCVRQRDDVVSVAGLRKLQKSSGMAWRGVGAVMGGWGVRMGGWVTFLCEMTWGLRNDMFRSLVARAVVSQPADPPAKLAK